MFKALFTACALACLATASARAAPPTAEVYATPDQVRLAALSPSGRWIAVVAQQNDHDVLRVYDADDLKSGSKSQAVMLDLASVRRLFWKGDDRIVFSEQMPALYFLSAGRSRIIMKTQLFSIDRGLKAFVALNPRPKIITEEPNIQDDVVSELPGDPNHIVEAIDWRTPYFPSVRKVDVRDGSFVEMRDRDPHVVDWLASPDGAPAIGFGDTTKSGPAYYRVATSGALTPFAAKGAGDTFAVLGFDRAPNRLVVLSDHEGGAAGLYIYDLDKDAFAERLFKEDRHDVEGAVWSFDGQTVVGADYDVDVGERTIFNADYAKALDAAEAAVGRQGLIVISATRDGKRLLVGSNIDGRVAETWWVDLSTHEARPFLKANPALEGVAPAKVAPVTFKARDGIDIDAYVTLPVGVSSLDQLKSAAFIVMPHGGPQARATADYDFETQFLASRGYAVIEPNFRGSAGYGAAFRAAGQRAWGEVIQDDIADAAAWVVDKGYADKSRMCVAGWSFGGYAALMASIRHPGLFKCAVDVAGPSDLETLIEDESLYYGGQTEAEALIGHAFKDRTRLHDDSPFRHAKDVAMPVLIVHGQADWTVAVSQSQFMNEALKGAHKDVQYVQLNLADHSLTRQSDRLAYLKALDAFLAKHNPAGAAQ